MSTKHLVLVGGGTAGHVIPTLAVASEAKAIDPDIELTYLGSTNPRDRKLVEDHDIDFVAMLSGKWRRYFSLLNFIDLFKVFFGFIQAFIWLGLNRPDILFIKGSHVGLVVGKAAEILNIPYVLHESDVVMGLANRLIAPGSEKIFTSWPEECFKEHNDKSLAYELTGLPVREEFYQQAGDDGEGKRLLILGGSQGAEQINQMIEEILPQLTEECEIYHQTGKRHLKHFAEIDVEGYHPFGFRDDLDELMLSADVIISRAGATAIFEIAAAGKPAILIPLPGSANNHQVLNAECLAEQNAVINLGVAPAEDELLESIDELARSQDKRKQMSKDISDFDHPQASRKIAEEIVAMIN